MAATLPEFQNRSKCLPISSWRVSGAIPPPSYPSLPAFWVPLHKHRTYPIDVSAICSLLTLIYSIPRTRQENN